jgi:hypothetical protein
MTYKQDLFLKQTHFGIKNEVQIDVCQGKVQVKRQFFLKSEEMEFDLHRVKPNTQKIKKWAWGWFLIAFGLTIGMVIALSLGLWSLNLTAKYKAIYLLSQFLWLVVTYSTWWGFLINSFQLTIFFDKYTEAPLFSLFTNKPEEECYRNFIENFKKIIITQEQARSIQTLLHEIPTYILVEEFSSSYLDELSKRGIDVIALLSFLQRKAMNMNGTDQRPYLQ